MRILILGGTAFIGYYAVESLRKSEENKIFLFNRGNRSKDIPEGVELIRGNRDKLDDFKTELRRINPDVVLDMMAHSDENVKPVWIYFKGIQSTL